MTKTSITELRFTLLFKTSDTKATSIDLNPTAEVDALLKQ